MATKFVVRNSSGHFLTHPRPTGKAMYQTAAIWTPDLQDARIFANKGSATRSDKPSADWSTHEVEVVLKP